MDMQPQKLCRSARKRLVENGEKPRRAVEVVALGEKSRRDASDGPDTNVVD